MQANLEVLDGLARRLDIRIPTDVLESEVESRLKRLARSVKMPGFRPGKAPLSAVARLHGAGVRQEVLGEVLGARFGEAVQAHQLKVAGYPQFAPKPGQDGKTELEFSAHFEVYPEVRLASLEDARLTRTTVTLTEADIDKTIEVLRQQRRRFEPVGRAAAEGDLVVFDYAGTIGGEPFEGSKGEDFSVVVGEGRLLKDFETALIGVVAPGQKAFDLTFPEDYPAKALAGRTARFEVTVKSVQAPVLPAVDADFARALGVADGDLGKLRDEVRANLEREVKRRTESRLKEQVMEALLARATLDVPRALVEMEIQRLMKMTESDMKARGVEQVKLSEAMFKDQAERRVRLGLVLSEIVKTHQLTADAARVRQAIEDIAQSYEDPAQVVKWYYQSPERMQEIESAVLEESVVAWVASQARLEEETSSFDELMGRA